MANNFTYNDQQFNVGDTINVSLKVTEGEKSRLQVFTGVLMAVRGREMGKSIVVRKIGAGGIGVERILPLKSPDIAKITRKASGKVRRAKLYYLRKRIGKSALRVKTDEIRKQSATASKKARRPRGSSRQATTRK